jgi:hypothetical protein
MASALSRVFGTTAPLLTGYLLQISLHVPLYVSAVLLAGAGVCMWMLPIETQGREAM